MFPVWTNGVQTAYTYDSLGRLLTAGSASYSYDGFGNRLTQTSPPMNLTYYSSNNRIATTGYSYDNNGNLTATPALTLAYDVENRLVEAVHTANGTERYRYAPSGQRVWKQKPLGTLEWYFYGVDGRLIGTYGSCQYYGTLFQETSTNVYFGGRTLQAQGQSLMKQDRLGTVQYSPTTNAPYGENVNYGAEGFGFTGYYRDGSTTGLDYAQQRYYAPAIGRFTTADPYQASAVLTQPQSFNRYTYVENDPVNSTDPNGLVTLQRETWPGPDGWGWGTPGQGGGGGGGGPCIDVIWDGAFAPMPLCFVPSPAPAPDQPVKPALPSCTIDFQYRGVGGLPIGYTGVAHGYLHVTISAASVVRPKW